MDHTFNVKNNLKIGTQYHERMKQCYPGGVHYNFNMPWEETPIHYAKTDRTRLWDMDGNEYLDFYARFGACILGHNNREYIEGLKETMDRVLCVSHTDLDAEVAETIIRDVPSAELVRFGLSGTEIVQNAIRLARAYTNKVKFIRFENHYHGNSDNILGGRVKKGDIVPHEFLGDYKGTLGRAPGSLEEQSFLLRWNDPELLEKVCREHHDEIAAIITEPVCVNGGSILPKPGYLEKMRALCDEYNIVLIFDEIITGFRMGVGCAQSYFGVTPDLTTLGKAIAGGGIPVSALVGKKKIMNLLTEKKVIHAGTFNGYPLGTTAIKITESILSRDDGKAIKQMNAYAEKIHKCMLDSAKKVGVPLVIQGPAGCAAYHCCEKPLETPSQYNFDIMTKDILLNDEMMKVGILVSTFSRIYPNILLNDDDVSWFADRIDIAMENAARLFEEIS